MSYSYIPKIKYNHIVTGEEFEVIFDSQPEGDPFNEKIVPRVSETRSNDGTRQVQHNYSMISRKVEFRLQSKEVYDNVKYFLSDHAMRGGTFSYYPSKEVDDFENWELDIKSVDFKRPTAGDEPDLFDNFLFDFSFTMERAVESVIELDTGEAGVGAISETSFTIENNQTVPADIVGLAFELPDTRSIRAILVEYTIYRNSTGPGALEYSEVGAIQGVWHSVEQKWYIQKQALGDAEVDITILDNGQLQYTSSNMTGTMSVSVMRFRARTISQEV